MHNVLAYCGIDGNQALWSESLHTANAEHQKQRPMEQGDERTSFCPEQKHKNVSAEPHADNSQREDDEGPKRRRARGRTRSKKLEKVVEEDIGSQALSLVEKMRAAAAVDNKNNEEQRPAIEKMALLDGLYGKLINRKYQSALMENGVLAAIRAWLEPLPDRSLPNIKIKKSMLEALMHMKVDTWHLESSQVGKIVNFYSLNPREDKDIRKLARALVQKWTKLVLSEEGL
eukprot:jgi/Antlo1/149/1814